MKLIKILKFLFTKQYEHLNNCYYCKHSEYIGGGIRKCLNYSGIYITHENGRYRVKGCKYSYYKLKLKDKLYKIKIMKGKVNNNV